MHRRCNQTPVSNICEAVWIFLFWAPNGLNELPEMHFKLPFNLIGKLTVALLTGQSWLRLKSRYTGWDPEQGFSCCLTDGVNQKFGSICGTG